MAASEKLPSAMAGKGLPGQGQVQVPVEALASRFSHTPTQLLVVESSYQTVTRFPGSAVPVMVGVASLVGLVGVWMVGAAGDPLPNFITLALLPLAPSRNAT